MRNKCAADVSIPSFVESLKSAVVKAGESATLQCTVECKPKRAKITWYVPFPTSVCLSVFTCVILVVMLDICAILRKMFAFNLTLD